MLSTLRIGRTNLVRQTSVKEPAVEHDAPGKPARLERAAVRRARSGGTARESDRPAGPAPKRRRSADPVWREFLARDSPAAVEDRRGRHQPRFDRRPDPFAALRIGEPRRVAHEQHAIVEVAARRRLREQIRVAAPAPGRVPRNAPARLQIGDESAVACGEEPAIQAAEADIEIVLFAKAPAVPLRSRRSTAPASSRSSRAPSRSPRRSRTRLSCATTHRRRSRATRVQQPRATGQKWPPAPTSMRRADRVVDDPRARRRGAIASTRLAERAAARRDRCSR